MEKCRYKKGDVVAERTGDDFPATVIKTTLFDNRWFITIKFVDKGVKRTALLPEFRFRKLKRVPL